MKPSSEERMFSSSLRSEHEAPRIDPLDRTAGHGRRPEGADVSDAPVTARGAAPESTRDQLYSQTRLMGLP